MKRVFFNLIISLVFIGSVSQVDAKNELNNKYQIIVDSATSAYKHNDFQKAIVFYQKLLTFGVESADIYYNLGNSYYKNSNIADAILYYEKALKINPAYVDAKFNLSLANNFITDRIVPVNVPFYKRWYKNMWQLMPADNWGVLSVVSFVLFLIMIFVFVFTSSIIIKKITVPFVILILFFIIVSLSLGNEAHNYQLNSKQGVVFESVLNVKSSPDDSGTVLFTVHEGLKINIRQKLGDWAEIEMPDGRVGWAETSTFKEI